METKATSPEKLWNAGFVYLVIVNTIISSAYGITLPLVPAYAVSMGAALSLAGAITGMFSASALFGRPLASLMGDRFNKKRLMIIFVMLNGVSVILYALAPGILWLLPVRILHGLAFSISGTIAFALSAGFVPQERLGEGIGYLGMTHIVGIALGPNIAIFFVERYSYQFCFAVAGLAIFAAGLSVSLLRCDITPAKTPPRTAGRTFSLRNLFAVELLPNTFFVAILAVGYGLINAYLVMLGKERNITNIGLYFIVNALVLVLARPVSGRIIDRKGVVYVVIPGFLLVGTAMTFIGQSGILWSILVAAVLAAIGFGAMPAFQADCMRRLDSSRKTLAASMYFIGMDVGVSTGQVFGGILIHSFSFAAAFNSTGGLMLAGLALYLLYRKLDKPRR